MIEELAGRMQSLKGPDREVDLLIMRYVENIGGPSAAAMHYTGSLDAAMTLIPLGVGAQSPHVLISVAPSAIARPPAKCEILDTLCGRGISANAATPAIAICIAALRARRDWDND